MTLAEVLPTVNACLNALSFVLLTSGYLSIRAKRPDLHRRFMIAAFAASCVFLVSYLTRFALTGTTRFAGEGLAKGLYLTILFTHMPLAALVVPLSLRALFLARNKRFSEHKQVTRILYPMWSYVSLTGVIVYLMLYHWPVPPLSAAASSQPPSMNSTRSHP